MTDKQTIFITWLVIFIVAFMGMVVVQDHVHQEYSESIDTGVFDGEYITVNHTHQRGIYFNGNDDYLDVNTNNFHGHNGTIDEINLYMKPELYEGFIQPRMKIIYINGSYRKVITQIKLNPEAKGWHYISLNPLCEVWFDNYIIVSNVNSTHDVHKCIYFVDGVQYTIIDKNTFMTAKWINFGNETVTIDVYIGDVSDRDRALMGFEIEHITPKNTQSEQNAYNAESKFIIDEPDQLDPTSSTSLVLDPHSFNYWTAHDRELLTQMMRVTAVGAPGIDTVMTFRELAPTVPVHVLETYIDLLESAGY